MISTAHTPPFLTSFPTFFHDHTICVSLELFVDSYGLTTVSVFLTTHSDMRLILVPRSSRPPQRCIIAIMAVVLPLSTIHVIALLFTSA
ncbi:hypothetical protein C8Q74DRAFT_743403 [Fomes fomentarius]|nr:hypothetical protein C8Q74DRAFT_743403 [Fomes fomentarius]